MKRIENPSITDNGRHLNLKLGDLECAILKGGEFQTFAGSLLTDAEIKNRSIFKITYRVDGTFYEKKDNKLMQYQFSIYRVLFSPYFEEKYLRKCSGQKNTDPKI